MDRQLEADDALAALQRHYADRLNEWETGFVASCREQRCQGRLLSPKQLDWLDVIWAAASGGESSGGRSARLR